VYANRTRLEHRELLLRVSELEQLTLVQDSAFELKKAEAVAMYIARSAPTGHIANLAMQAMSAVVHSNGNGDLKAIVARLRQAISEANSS
jgi:hypothetical protein